jgi:AraC family cel operon transcriptional repressor
MRMARSIVLQQDSVYALQSLGPAGPWQFPAHRHEGWSEIQVVLQGTLHQVVNGRPEELTAGGVMLIRREDEHQLSGHDFLLFNLLIPDAEWQRLGVYLDDRHLLTRLEEAPHPPRLHLTGADRERLEADLRQLFTRQKAPGARALLGSVLLTWLPRLGGGHQPAHPALTVPVGVPSWLRGLLDDLDGLLDLGLDTAGLAQHAGVSAEHLARTVRKHLGVTPTELLNHRRLERAALLLSHTDSPVLTIALDLGFGSASVFSRAFRARHGLAPRAWRQRYGVGWRA